MMICEQYEILMADVLGGEASPANRTALEEHCAACPLCRDEFESAVRTLEAMRSLSAPAAVLPFDPARAGGTRKLARSRFAVGGFWRYAAGIVVAFSAGYLFHAGRTGSTGQGPVAPDRPILERGGGAGKGEDFEAALASAHFRNPSRSDLAKCMSAVLNPRN